MVISQDAQAKLTSIVWDAMKKSKVKRCIASFQLVANLLILEMSHIFDHTLVSNFYADYTNGSLDIELKIGKNLHQCLI
jgi:hypothetical protein